MKNRYALFYVATLALAAGLVACDDERDLGEPLKRVETIASITIEPTRYNAGEQVMYMLPNEEIQLSCVVLPEDAGNKNVLWTSSNERVATVTPDGYLVTKAEGSTVVRVMPEIGFGPAEATPAYTLNVVNHYNYIETIEVSNPPAEDEPVAVTATYQLKVTATPEDATFKRYRWESLTPEIATVDENGVVTGVAEGEATIRITADDFSANPVSIDYRLRIKAAVPIEDFEFAEDPELDQLGYGEQYRVVCDLTPANATYELLEWSSDNPDVISVDDKGYLQVHSVTNGSATITASYNGISKSKVVTIGEGRCWFSFGEGLGPWTLESGNKSSVAGYDGEKTTIQMGNVGTDNVSYRGDLTLVNNKGVQTLLNPSVYRYLALKFAVASSLVPKSNANGCLKLELFDKGTATIGNNYRGEVGDNNNSFAILGDGTFQTDVPNILYYDLQSTYDVKTPTDWNQVFTLEMFKFVIADYKVADTYDIYWVRSFKTLEELEEYVNNENN